MERLGVDLTKAMTAEYMRRGMDPRTAAYHGANLARLVMSRWDAGHRDDMLTVGLDGFFKNLVKAVTKPFKKAAKFVGKKVIKPITKGVRQAGRQIEKHILKPVGKGTKQLVQQIEKHVVRPVAHWEHLSLVANIVPGYGQVLSGVVAAAQAANTIYSTKRDSKKAEQNYRMQVQSAYDTYLIEAMKAGVRPLTIGEFQQAIEQGI